MKLGIVGLPNVGKSTLFNSLTRGGAESANYPFCTIDPTGSAEIYADRRDDPGWSNYSTDARSFWCLASTGIIFS